MALFNTCEVRVGRLMEIAVDAGYGTPADVDAMIGMIGATLDRLPASSNVVIAADWRGVHLMKQDAAARAHTMLTARSPRVERSAILASGTSSTEMFQFFRLVRESEHPNRRVFDDPRAMQDYLGAVLTPVERHRLDVFLARTP